MTLNGVMALTMHYFTEFDKPAFEHITASVHVEVINQTHRVVKFACVTKRKNFSVTFNLSF